MPVQGSRCLPCRRQTSGPADAPTQQGTLCNEHRVLLGLRPPTTPGVLQRRAEKCQG